MAGQNGNEPAGLLTPMEHPDRRTPAAEAERLTGDSFLVLPLGKPASQKSRALSLGSADTAWCPVRPDPSSWSEPWAGGAGGRERGGIFLLAASRVLWQNSFKEL